MKKTSLLIALLAAAVLTSGHAQGTWTQRADFGGGPRLFAAGFSIGGHGYIGTGYGNGSTNDFWEYDPGANTWTQKANFAGGAVSSQTGFSIGASKGYLGPYGFSEYDPAANSWTQKAPYPGFGASQASSFSIGNKGYMGAGSFRNDFWQYDPTTDTWAQKANVGDIGRSAPVGFSIGSIGYMGTGQSVSQYLKDFWAFDPAANTWTQKADFGGSARAYATGFAIANKGYIGTGRSDDSYGLKDFWAYDPSSNTWTQKADFGGNARTYATGFSIGGKGYIGTGEGVTYVDYQDFWEYSPDGGGGGSCDTPTSLLTANVSSTTADLQWDSVSGAVEYEVGYKVVGTSQFTIVHSTGNSTTISGLMPLTQYVWRVRTVCSLSPPIKSAYSAQVQFTTTNGCDVPTGLFSEPTATRAFLAWDTVDKAISYEIMYQVAGDPLWATVRARGSFITLRGLTPRTTYYWKVKTICSDSPPVSSEYSAQESFFTFPR